MNRISFIHRRMVKHLGLARAGNNIASWSKGFSCVCRGLLRGLSEHGLRWEEAANPWQGRSQVHKHLHLFLSCSHLHSLPSNSPPSHNPPLAETKRNPESRAAHWFSPQKPALGTEGEWSLKVKRKILSIDSYCWCLVAKSCLTLLQPLGL